MFYISINEKNYYAYKSSTIVVDSQRFFGPPAVVEQMNPSVPAKTQAYRYSGCPSNESTNTNVMAFQNAIYILCT